MKRKTNRNQPKPIVNKLGLNPAEVCKKSSKNKGR